MTDVEILDFLEHHGVKGMKWGVRGGVRASKNKEFSERSKGQKAIILGTSLATGLAAVNLLMRTKAKIPITVLGSAAAAEGGALLAEKLLDKHGSRKMSKGR